MRPLLGVIAMLTVSILAGCSRVDVPDINSPLSSPGVTLPPSLFPSVDSRRSVPPATHHWKTDGLACPSVTRPAAVAAGIAGVGKVVDADHLSALGDTISCQWGPADGTAPSAIMNLTTTTQQAAADRVWAIGDSTLKQPLNGVGEQAFMSEDVGFDETRIAVRSGNATVRIQLLAKRNDAGSRKALRGAAADIANDLLTCLVPA
ncbi:hypothetical protein ACWT_1362 [Actinoplanes sp. SE50]|uniref:hypothetical protein n=1 Tax=unclassified Actinoplanes TaxID=2626549 RepID=UPI00023EBE9A|nr:MULTISPECIES: hypothetical protein [unclassified Actinoplanes]AEV82380.1 hypothetical protein ACPL_1483 [Actinoplanes sp. SE50/110]ATO80777.1 hypothetical protein ACWT_1362 [Actinoplanes sp. SE50]SLL98185.1 hypothetical protein ACSP50_1409 [Actinoplanes sp. SE50/110]